MAGPFDVSPRILAETPARALAFLHGVAASKAIRSLLWSTGYRAAEHAEGWELLGRVCRYRDPGTPEYGEAGRRATEELEAWADRVPRRIQLALARLHPAQEKLVFENLARGPGGVVATGALLDRLDALEAPGRGASRAGNQAALATLAQRGITADERRRLRVLCETAKALPPLEGTEPDVAVEDLRALRAWFAEWSEAARSVITRRDHLIRLGLVRRKARSA